MSGGGCFDPSAGLLAAFLFATAPFVRVRAAELPARPAAGGHGGPGPTRSCGTEDLRPPVVLGLGLVLGLGMPHQAALRRLSVGTALWAAWRGSGRAGSRARLLAPARGAGRGGSGRAARYGPRLGGCSAADHQSLRSSRRRESGHAPALSGRCCSIRSDHSPVGVSRPPRLHALGIWRRRRGPAAASPSGRALVPFRDLRPDPEQEPALRPFAARRRAGCRAAGRERGPAARGGGGRLGLRDRGRACRCWRLAPRLPRRWRRSSPPSVFS